MTLDKLMPLFRIGDEPFLFSLPKKFKMSCRCNRRSLSPQAEQASTRKQHALAVLFGTALLSGLIILRSVHAENIKIGLPSVTITAMPFFVAKEHGFFQQEGLNAEMVVMPASLNIKVLLAGDIQYAATIGSAVAASIRDVNVRTIMLFVDRPLLDLVGAPGITSIAAMRGKLAGISSRGGLHDIVMQRILAQSKIDPGQVTIITVGGQGSMLTAIKSGRIAAGLLNPPHNFLAYREGLNRLGFAGDFARLRILPLLGGAAYTFGNHPILVSVGAVAGPSFNKITLEHGFLRTLPPGSRAIVGTSTSFAVRPGVGVAWTVTPRIGIVGFGGYMFNRPDVLYRDADGREFRDRWDADSVVLSAAAVYSFF